MIHVHIHVYTCTVYHALYVQFYDCKAAISGQQCVRGWFSLSLYAAPSASLLCLHAQLGPEDSFTLTQLMKFPSIIIILCIFMYTYLNDQDSSHFPSFQYFLSSKCAGFQSVQCAKTSCPFGTISFSLLYRDTITLPDR